MSLWHLFYLGGKGMVIEDIYYDLVNYFGKDVKRINHATKVWVFARIIGKREALNEETQLILEISAILHDIGIKVCEERYGSTAGNLQELEGPKEAIKILEKYPLDNRILERVLFLIGNHHSYEKIDNIDFQILVEADFLVNIFEDNIDKSTVEYIKEKYFKTETGKYLMNIMYG